jgi:Fur family transcriptional regulator, ferric uptake regulator
MTALKSSPVLKATGIEARCAATGMRMTEQRRVIARVLAEAADHPDVEELYRRCVAVDDKISISTVYRTVKLFEDAGITIFARAAPATSRCATAITTI